MTDEIIDRVVEYYSKRIYDIQFSKLPINPIKKSVDMDCRIVSDFISCENITVSHSTPHIIRHCKYWSEGAIKLFKSLEGSVTQRIDAKASNGKRIFAVEHQYPLGIIKHRVVNKEFKSAKEVKDYFLKYGRVTIVTEEENRMLNTYHKSASTIKEATDRYSNFGIKPVRFSIDYLLGKPPSMDIILREISKEKRATKDNTAEFLSSFKKLDWLK